MRTLSQTDSPLIGVATGLAPWWLAAVSDLLSIMLSDGNGASNQRCRFCRSVFPVIPVQPKAGGKFCADQTGNIVSDWRSEPSSRNTKCFSSSLTTSQSVWSTVTSSEVQGCVGVASSFPRRSSFPRSPSLLEEAGQDVEEAMVDALGPAGLSCILLRASFCFRALLHGSLQLHLAAKTHGAGTSSNEQ